MNTQLTLKKIFNAYPLVEGKCLPDNLSSIAENIVSRKEEIFPGSDFDAGYDYIANDWKGYHDYVCLEKFPQLSFMLEAVAESLELIGDDYTKYFFKSWINIWPKGQTIGYHKHYGTWHGNFVIRDTGTLTYYASSELPGDREVVALKNFNGHFVFMPGHIWHWGQKNTSSTLRISSAFNLSTWDEVLLEEKESHPKIKDVVLPLKDYI